uniref:Uncharacterized protein n=1 Tax=viral metagenome TaxID=1070528 RepID=A0A6C0HMC6_9ZZZZ
MATYPEPTSTEGSPAKPKKQPAIASFVVPASCYVPRKICDHHMAVAMQGKLLAILAPGCGIEDKLRRAFLESQQPDSHDPYNILTKRACAISACDMCDAENESNRVDSTPVFVSVPQYGCDTAPTSATIPAPASRKRKASAEIPIITLD